MGVTNSFPEKDHPHENYDQRKQEHKQRYAVDTMHIAYPLGMGPVGIFLFYVEIFGYLTPDSHDVYCHTKLKRTINFESKKICLPVCWPITELYQINNALQLFFLFQQLLKQY